MHLIIDNEPSIYKNLVQSAKRCGYQKFGSGKPSINELESYIYKNINKIEPQIKPKRKYSSMYYNELFYLAVQNGFINDRVGKQKERTLIDFLTSQNVDLPPNQIVIYQHRKKLSDCKTRYERLLFEAKSLGYTQPKLGRPSFKSLECYLQIG
jgi:hypothetical protein